MRQLICAVLMCIATFAIAGCNSRMPDFRRSRWGDSRHQVKSSEFDIQRNSESPDKLGIPSEETQTAVFYRTTLKLREAQRSTDVTIRYRFDENERLRSVAYKMHARSVYKESSLNTLIKHALIQHGEPTYSANHVGARLQYEQIAHGENRFLRRASIATESDIISERYISWETRRSWITLSATLKKDSYNWDIQWLYRPIEEFRTSIFADRDWREK